MICLPGQQKTWEQGSEKTFDEGILGKGVTILRFLSILRFPKGQPINDVIKNTD